TIERQGQLFLHQDGHSQRPWHFRCKVHHLLPSSNRSIGEEQIDEYAGFHRVEIAERGFECFDGIEAATTRAREFVFLFARIVQALAKNIGLFVLDVGKRLNELKDGTVDKWPLQLCRRLAGFAESRS